jgi:hypothetical protein
MASSSVDSCRKTRTVHVREAARRIADVDLEIWIRLAEEVLFIKTLSSELHVYGPAALYGVINVVTEFMVRMMCCVQE